LGAVAAAGGDGGGGTARHAGGTAKPRETGGAVMGATLLSLLVIFAGLSLVSFGGGNTILPEMQRQVVDVHHWLSAQQFGALFALSQAAPGPNMLVGPLIGWQVAGFAGLAVVTVAKFGPSSILTGLALHLWERQRHRPWRASVQRGLVPLTTGMVMASAAIIATGAATTVTLCAISAAATVAALTGRLHPLVILGAGALAGVTLGAG
ncbi:chromate transporter, partial [Endobacter medicaginis]